MARAKIAAADAADTVEEVAALIETLIAASRSAAQAGRHPEHAALESVLTAAYVFKGHAARAIELVGEELADQIKAITDKL